MAAPLRAQLRPAQNVTTGDVLTRNVVANLLGRGWISLTIIAVTPSYLAALGVEAYGLIGAFAVIQTMLLLFDFGLGLTLNREFARLSSGVDAAAGLMSSLLRTFEATYWAVGLGVGAALIALASPVSTIWFHPLQLSPTVVSTAIALMGVTVAVQWPSALYSGGLLGLRRQVTANTILAASATLRTFGALAVLQITPTISAFFAWQVFVSIVQTVLLRFSLRRALPRSAVRARFEPSLLWANASFAAGVTGITVLGAAVTQLDKVVLSSLVTLQDFGYYVLASTVASGLYVFVTPVFNAAFPHLVSARTDADLESSYRRACQIGSLALLPPAVTLVLFAPEALSAWLGDEQQRVGGMVWLVRILAVGTAVNGLLNLPYALMLARRWTTTLLWINAVAFVLLVPLILILVGWLGPTGAAISWLSYNFATALVLAPLLHRRLLVGHLRSYGRDIGAPFLAALGGAALVRLAIAEPGPRPSKILTLVLALGMSAGLAWFVSKDRPSPVRALKRYLSRDVSAAVGP